MMMMQRRVLVTAVLKPQGALLLSRRCFSSSEKASVFVRAWQSYSQALYRNPLTTKATAAAVIFFVSDSATQYLTRDRQSDFKQTYSLSRALSGSAFGIVATGFLHVWWGFLERAVGVRLPVAQHRLANTMTKVFLDQSIGAPFYIYSYYVVTNFLQNMSNNPEDKSPEEILQETRTKASSMLWPTMLRHWRLWPLVHSFNFYFVPLHHRVLVQNLVLVGWSGCKFVLDAGSIVGLFLFSNFV
jgi:protein Mpv17